MKVHLRWAIGALLVLGAVTIAAAPAFAQDGDRPRDTRDTAVTITGRVEIAAGENVDGPVISIDGPVSVAGFVDGDVYVAHGDVVITETARVNGSVVVAKGDVKVLGRVNDDVVVFSGRAVVNGGTVGGDVSSSKDPRVINGGRVRGDVNDIDATGWFTAIGLALLAYLWIAVSISVLVIGLVLFLVFPRSGDALVRVAHDAVGKSIGWGAIVAFGGPIAALLVIGTVVALPLGIGALIAIGLLCCLGYVATAAAIGRLIVKEKSAVLAFLTGFAILRVLALIPGLGVLVWILASAYGVGVITVASYRAGRRSRPDQSDAPPAEPIEPTEPSEPAAEPAAQTTATTDTTTTSDTTETVEPTPI